MANWSVAIEDLSKYTLEVNNSVANGSKKRNDNFMQSEKQNKFS